MGDPIDPLQFSYNNFGNLCTRTQVRCHLSVPPYLIWLFVLEAIGEHYFLSSCILASQSQNKQSTIHLFGTNSLVSDSLRKNNLT